MAVEIDVTDIRLIAAGDFLIFTSDRPCLFANREKTGPSGFSAMWRSDRLGSRS
jgi:hypothetical protein